MAPKGTIPDTRRSAVEVAEDLKAVRHLIGVADQQISKARTDLGVARVRIAELERELTSEPPRDPRREPDDEPPPGPGSLLGRVQLRPSSKPPKP